MWIHCVQRIYLVHLSSRKKSLDKLKNVFFKSSSEDKDLQKFSNEVLHSMLEVINSNVLYLTYRIDKISAQQKTLDAKEYYGNTDNRTDSDKVSTENSESAELSESDN